MKKKLKQYIIIQQILTVLNLIFRITHYSGIMKPTLGHICQELTLSLIVLKLKIYNPLTDSRFFERNTDNDTVLLKQNMHAFNSLPVQFTVCHMVNNLVRLGNRNAHSGSKCLPLTF